MHGTLASAINTASFNPRPAVRPGDARLGASVPAQGFNPRPAVRPGDAGPPTARPGGDGVSIRARP